MNDLLRSELAGLSEYSLPQRAHRIKLNQNENPYELPDAIKREILERVAAERWSRYPPFVPTTQLGQVAQFTGWRPDGVLLGNGSNDILQLLFTCALGKGRSVVISQPTFTLYALLAQSLGATVVHIPMLQGFTFDVEGLIRAARETDAALTVVCSPNNPTGTHLGLEEAKRLADGVPGIVVIDEAYVQFAPFSVMELLRGNSRLVIMQTFSKAMGAAGLRFGYGLMDPAIARQLNKVKLPYAVNIFTLIAAEVLMARWNEVKWWLGKITLERERVRNVIGALPGITVYPSAANFLLFESERKSPAELFDALCNDGILIRDVSRRAHLARALRVSIGTPAENDEFLTSLRRAL